jgi:16S rRNA (guanine527-N7)-methyltransferase
MEMDIILKYFSEFSAKQLHQLELLEPLYREWNEQINVISRKDIEGLYEKHVLHSLSIAAVFEFSHGMQVLDLGTGGGFPGIPLAIFYPDVKFHLVDSIAKKLKVVNAVAEGIGLTNITTYHSRVEDMRTKKSSLPGGGYDFVVSRAVAPLKDLWKWSKPLLKIKTSAEHTPGLICLKGGDLAAEIHDSGLKPRVVDLETLFSEEYYKAKYMLYVTR